MSERTKTILAFLSVSFAIVIAAAVTGVGVGLMACFAAYLIRGGN